MFTKANRKAWWLMEKETETPAATPVAEPSDDLSDDPEAVAFASIADEIESEDREGDEVPVIETPSEEPKELEGKGKKGEGDATPPKEEVREEPETPPAVAQKPAAPTPPTSPEQVVPAGQGATEQPVAPTAERPEPPTAEEMQARENAYLETLVGQYALDEETADALAVDPGKVYPELAAKLHMQVVRETTLGLMEFLPQIIGNVIKQNTDRDARETAFYGRWPKLAGHEQQVNLVAKMYREARPDLSPEDFIEQAGMHAMLMLGIPIEEAPETPVAVQPAASKPTVTSPPARPAPSVPGKPAAKGNTFTELAEIIERDEDEEF